MLVTLRNHYKHVLSDTPPTLPDLIVECVSGMPKSPSKEWFNRQLSAGKCLVLFDGLDEVGSERDRKLVAEWIEGQFLAYPSNPFVVSSRPFAYKAVQLGGFTLLQVRPFTADQVRRFLIQWYLATSIRRTGRNDVAVRAEATNGATELLTRLEENPSLRDLVVNPLLLTMIAHVHFYRSALPGSRADLYREICEVFLGNRQEAKKIASPVNVNQKELVIRELAMNLTLSRKRDATTKHASDVIHKRLKRVTTTIQPQQFLRMMNDSGGLLLEREPGIYSFAHLTIQEYLTAVEIRESGSIQLLLNNTDDVWWRETILLYAAHADASELISKCLRPDASAYELTLAADCIAEARDVEPSLRMRLEQRLDLLATSSEPEMQRLSAGVRLLREFRQGTYIGGGVTVAQSPVTNVEYEAFIAHSKESKSECYELDHMRSLNLVDGSGTGPVLGMRASDAVMFARWTQVLVGGGWNVRLPTPLEAALIDAKPNTFNGSNTYWVAEDRSREATIHNAVPVSVTWDTNRLLQRLAMDFKVIEDWFGLPFGKILDVFGFSILAIEQGIAEDCVSSVPPIAPEDRLDTGIAIGLLDCVGPGLVCCLARMTKQWYDLKRVYTGESPSERFAKEIAQVRARLTLRARSLATFAATQHLNLDEVYREFRLMGEQFRGLADGDLDEMDATRLRATADLLAISETAFGGVINRDFAGAVPLMRVVARTSAWLAYLHLFGGYINTNLVDGIIARLEFYLISLHELEERCEGHRGAIESIRLVRDAT